MEDFNIVDFQTPPWLCRHIVGKLERVIPKSALVVEPTPGAGNMVEALRAAGYTNVEFPPGDFFDWTPSGKPVAVVGNPPWTPNTLAYKILDRCLEFGPDFLVMLMPWYTLTNSDSRAQRLRAAGLQTVISLPRGVFQGVRINSCVLVIEPGTTADFQTLLLPTVQELGKE